MRQKLLYFGHPISFYDTPIEKRLEETILTFFPNFRLVNPNRPFFHEGYLRWKKETGNGRNFYFKEILPNMDAGIFLAFPEDMRFGKEVYGEAEMISSRVRPIYEINLELKISPLILNPVRMLTVEETKARIYESDGRTIKKWAV